MVPNISSNGASFRGAGAYHLHDKPLANDPRPRTAERLLFTATRNLANDDARLALDEMWHTARDAAQVKAITGTKPTGRKNDAPVKSISLAWAPHETPSHTQMIAAADDFLLTMGWQTHQAIFAAHRDTAHPHLHIILNRVNPTTGRTLSDWQDRKRAQQWALSFERRHGQLLCPARAARYERNSRTVPSSLPHDQTALLKQHHAASAIRRATRQHFRPAWRDYFRMRRQLRTEFRKQTLAAQRAALSFAREGDDNAAAKHFRANQQARATNQHVLKTARRHLRLAQLRYIRQRIANAPAPDYRAERKRLFANQASGYAALRATPSSNPATLAQSEITVQFANRWAEIRKGPAHLRAAASAALAAEQHAAVESRTRELANWLGSSKHAAFAQLSQRYRTERRTLTRRQREGFARNPDPLAQPVRQGRGPTPSLA
jgi:relaxase-like protein